MYQTLCLATDLEPASRTPWETAWRLAAAAKANLVALHAPAARGRAPWHRLPRPADLMKAWGFAGEAIELGFRGDGWTGSMRTTDDDDPAALAFWLQFERPDLVVLGTHRRAAASRLFKPSTGELLSRAAPRVALVIPDDVRGFVAPDGTVRLRRVLVPVAPTVDAQAAVDATALLVQSAGLDEPTAFIVLHVGEHVPTLKIPAPHVLFLTLGLAAPDAVSRRIAGVARDLEVDLVAMVTQGHDSLSDTLLGSHTDRVIRNSPCPVLVVPA